METVLWSYWKSSASWRVRIALNLKGVPYRYEAIDLFKSQQATPEYAGVNPMLQVPTLLIDGKKFTQSLAIIRYLELTRPQVKLVPEDPYLEARMWEICEIINSGIQPLHNLSVLKKVEELGGNKNEWGKEAIVKGLSAVEELLYRTSGDYAIGNTPTAADCCIVPQLYAARRFDVSLRNYVTLEHIEKMTRTNLAFIRANLENQPDSPHRRG
mmetsp:Transcript_9496/g.18353  ORF Transcript_9496/g.18353 Transcript_9496/m.18353 type:complete len:213 (-) Transcript_9496:5704-6342(-)